MNKLQVEMTEKKTLLSEPILISFTLISVLFFSFFPLFKYISVKKSSDYTDVFVTASSVELGGFRPDEIKVFANNTLRITFWAMDVRHSFNLPQLGIDLPLTVGEHAELIISTGFRKLENEYEYIINRKSFKFYLNEKDKKIEPLILEFKCNIYCSLQHWDMRGKLIIFPPK